MTAAGNGALDLALDGESDFEAQVRRDAPGDIAVAWVMVMGDEPLAQDVRDAAADELLAGGFHGVPGMFVMFGTDPREAIAAVLERDGDPLAAVFREAVEAEEARGEMTYQFRGRTHNSVESLVRAIGWGPPRTTRRLRVPFVSRLRSRRPRRRRADRAPPGGDDDPSERPDVDSPSGDAR